MKKVIKIILLFLAMVLISTDVILAAEFRIAKDDGDGNITISQEEEVKNLYAGGNIISISADVEKSLYVGGNVVTIDGDIEDNLAVGGGTVMLRGDVGGTVHAGGGTVIIDGAITDDLFIGGGTVTISDTASVGGDLIVGGGVVNIQGPIEGNVLLGAGQATIDSKIGGQVEAEVEKFLLGDNAEVTGDIVYKSPEEMEMADGAVVLGEVKFDQASVKTNPTMPAKALKPKVFVKFASFGLLIKLVVSAVTSLTLVSLFNKWIGQTTKEALTNFWASLGVGFAALLLTPVVGVILMITLIGAWLGALLMAIYSLMILLSLSIASISFGSWLMKLFGQRSKYLVDWKAALLGALAMSLVILVPVVGGLLYFIFMLISLGSLYRLVYRGMIAKK
jgi:hypothetical protein